MKPKITDLFHNRFVQVILFSGLFLQIGIWVRNFAVLLFVMEKTGGNSFAVSMISVAEFAPIFVFSFIGGTFADRWRPKRTMIWCDFLSAVSVFGVLLTLIFTSWKAVFFATLFSAILSQFSQPSGMKLFKLHVPAELIQMGMSGYQTIFAVFMILGPVLGTFVYQNFGINVAIAVMGIAFLLSAGVLLFLPFDRLAEAKQSKPKVFQEMAGGFRYVLSKKSLTLLGINFMTAGLALGLIQPLGIFIITERLGLAKELVQWFMMANGGGMILGSGLAMFLSRKTAPQKLLALGMLVNAIGITVIGWSAILWLSLLTQFFCGLVLPGIQVGINTMILQNTATDFVGRVNGILSPLFTGSLVLTMSMAGGLKQLFSLVAIYQVSGVLFLIGLLLLIPIFNMPGNPGTAAELSPEAGETIYGAKGL